MFGYYNNGNLRKLVVAFGSLFSNIYVTHDDPAGGPDIEIRVPITYAPQEKFIQRYLNPSSITDGTRIENQLPRLSYIITSVVPDPSRRRNRFTPSLGQTASCEPNGNVMYNEIPVNVNFNLYIYTRHTDDTMQIVEQIMPYFVPDHVLKIDMNSVHQNVQIPLVMGSNNLTERYDGDFSNRRINISSFNFVAKSYIFGKIVSASTIDTSGITLTFIDEYQ